MHSLFFTRLSACLLALACVVAPVQAQDELDDSETFASGVEVPGQGTPLTREEAQRILAEPVPADPAAAYALLERQERAARSLEMRGAQLQTLHRLVELGRARGDMARWLLLTAELEFQQGSQGKAVEFTESFVNDASVPLDVRAALALRQSFFLHQLLDPARGARSYARAEALVEQALADPALKEPQRLRILQLQARSEVERMRGDLEGSLASLRAAVAIGRNWSRQIAARKPGVTPQDPEMRASLLVTQYALGPLSWALSALSRHTEAVAVASEGLRMAEADALGAAFVQQWHFRLASAHLGNREFDQALAAATAADAMAGQVGASGASHVAWRARRERILALIGLNRWAEADELYRSFVRHMPPDALARNRAAEAHLDALLAAKNGRSAAALEVIEAHIRYRTWLFGENHPLTRESRGVRAVVHLLGGNLRPAIADYEDLFAATLDRPSGWTDLGITGPRGYTLSVAFDEFLRHVAAASRRGEPLEPRLVERALQVADYLSLTVTHEALVDSTARFLAQSPALRELLAQEQAQRQRLRELYRDLAGMGARMAAARDAAARDAAARGQGSSAAREALAREREAVQRQRETIATEQTKLDALRETIARQHPAYADLVTPPTPTVAALRQLLQPGEALVMVYPTDTATLVWSVARGGAVGFHAAPLTATQLARDVVPLRKTLDLSTTFGPQPPPVQGQGLHDLYRQLLQPLEPSLAGAGLLLVVAQGPLASVPFAALLTAPPGPAVANGSAPWLVRRWAVAHLPSLSSVQSLRRAERPAAALPLIGFGDPLFGPAPAAPAAPAGPVRRLAGAQGSNATSFDVDQGLRYLQMPPLPETRAELQAIAAALKVDPAGHLHFGADASRRRVLDTDLSNRRVVAFATHGLVPGELPGVSKPALAMAATSVPGESPLLTLDDVLGLKLNAQWVLLSGCNTAASEAGGAALSGLVRGFFHAGARSVLATHWAVETESAAALVSATFAHGAADTRRSRAASLREAQLAMIDGKLGNAVWSHPFFWAPYSLFGDPAK